ncbi:TatB [Desulforapulum autotrophicum HRM2]|uniref:Sec-independent protein translocase protein TatA n=1 Tax=Desulforapulum autotrophicum (strain ATCC 43914 / DSM 3382 / VKM B-1955 / HRM2) TaxID=177437 RepID=C0QD58_DESAH|nr:twin-arginine translocase TatA/TatE family subunit [Desulforapulum autotrophicum]ACN17290.1 TatB [Desulforapulum autotrophicum HRM2]
MFGLGMPEILLILAIALMVIGPKKLPELAKTLGRAMGEFKKAAQDFKRSIDLEETARKFEAPAKSIRETIKEATPSPEENPAATPEAVTPADQAPSPDKGDNTPHGNQTSNGDGAKN